MKENIIIYKTCTFMYGFTKCNSERKEKKTCMLCITSVPGQDFLSPLRKLLIFSYSVSWHALSLLSVSPFYSAQTLCVCLCTRKITYKNSLSYMCSMSCSICWKGKSSTSCMLRGRKEKPPFYVSMAWLFSLLCTSSLLTLLPALIASSSASSPHLISSSPLSSITSLIISSPDGIITPLLASSLSHDRHDNNALPLSSHSFSGMKAPGVKAGRTGGGGTDLGASKDWTWRRKGLENWQELVKIKALLPRLLIYMYISKCCVVSLCIACSMYMKKKKNSWHDGRQAGTASNGSWLTVYKNISVGISSSGSRLSMSSHPVYPMLLSPPSGCLWKGSSVVSLRSFNETHLSFSYSSCLVLCQ